MIDHPHAPPQSAPEKPSGFLRARRFVLLATTIAGLSAAAFVVSPNVTLFNGTPAYAQNLTKEAANIAHPVGFADIVAKVKPAVMSVRVKMDGDAENSSFSGNNGQESPFPPGSPMERFFRQFGSPNGTSPRFRQHHVITGQGSGFFISADGYAVTNNHVVEKAETVQVTTDDGKVHKAKVIGTDPRTDLALIKVEGSDFPFVKLAENSARIGDWVLAVGNPFGLGGTVTAGILSARGRDIGAGPYDDFLQIDAPVNKGNSGGPTFDVEGNVIGVNTAIFSPSGGSVGIAFAIPSDTVKSVVAQLKENGSVTRGWIGVQIQPVTQDIADSLGLKKVEGALVAEPQDNSPATKAGIKSGDVITAVNGEDVKDARDLARKIGTMAPGTSVKLAIMRDGSQKDLSLTLGELPKQEKQARLDSQDEGKQSGDVGKLGLTLGRGNGDGVPVTDIDPDGAAADHGLKVGDVILDVSGSSVSSARDVTKAVNEARESGKKSVLMRVKSSRGTRFVAVPLGKAA